MTCRRARLRVAHRTPQPARHTNGRGKDISLTATLQAWDAAA